MENENKQFEPKAPDFTGEGIAVWKRLDKNGNEYLSIKLVGHNTLTAFKYIPKEKATSEEAAKA